MKNKKAIALAALAMGAAFEAQSQITDGPKFEKKPLTKEQEELILRKAIDREIERMMCKGLKPFDINGQIIWAINEKNAKRKALKNQKEKNHTDETNL